MRSILYQQKSWKMIDTINGATISAIIYSIAGTAKANILKPYEYFCHPLPEIPTHMEDKVQSILGESVALVTEVTREHHETKLKPFTASRESDLQLSRYLLYCIYENYTIIVSFTKLKFKQCHPPPAPIPICKVCDDSAFVYHIDVADDKKRPMIMPLAVRLLHSMI